MTDRVRFPLLALLYDLTFVVCCVLGSPVFLFRMLRSPKDRAGLGQRLGLGLPVREGHAPCLWVHGVSVGEVQAAASLVRSFATALPGWEIVVSSTTMTGHSLARRLYPNATVFYFPLDFGPILRAVLKRIRPDALVLMELEIWPNLLLRLHHRGIPAFVVNGRISKRSFGGYRLVIRLIRDAFRHVTLYCVQNREYADRLEALGIPAERILVTGNMKYDNIGTGEAEEQSVALREVFRIQPDDWVLVGGSTHEGEEEVLLDVHREMTASGAPLRLILAPRHPERIRHVEAMIAARGGTSVRRSRLGGPGGRPSRGDVILVDTIGELRMIYAFASVVFVGGSLVAHGGQNMMEPAGLGKAVVFGPHTFNFREDVRALLEGGAAVEVSGASELRREIAKLVRDPGRLWRLGERARQVVRSQQGATAKTLAALARRLGVAGGRDRRSDGLPTGPRGSPDDGRAWKERAEGSVL